jgi:excisionase family DNA binding protein
MCCTVVPHETAEQLMNELLEAAEAALRAGISREALVRMIQRKRLRGHRADGRYWMVDATDLDRLIREREGSQVAQGAS